MAPVHSSTLTHRRYKAVLMAIYQHFQFTVVTVCSQHTVRIPCLLTSSIGRDKVCTFAPVFGDGFSSTTPEPAAILYILGLENLLMYFLISSMYIGISSSYVTKN